jgi:hypothetical protein
VTRIALSSCNVDTRSSQRITGYVIEVFFGLPDLLGYLVIYTDANNYIKEDLMKKRNAGDAKEKGLLSKIGKSRRGFIRKLVKGAAYVTPLIATFYMDSTKDAYAQRSSTAAGGEKKGAKKGAEKKGGRAGTGGGGR